MQLTSIAVQALMCNRAGRCANRRRMSRSTATLPAHVYVTHSFGQQDGWAGSGLETDGDHEQW